MLPSTGTITHWSPPQGPGIRVDAGVTAGSEVSHYYDPMLAKLIVERQRSSFGDCATATRARRFYGRRGANELAAACSGSRAMRPFARAKRRRAFSTGASTSRSSRAARRRPKRCCSARRRCSPTAARRGASATSACRCDCSIAGGVVELRGGRGGQLGVAGESPEIATASCTRQRHGEIVRADFDGTALAGVVTYHGNEFNVHLDGRTWPFEFARHLARTRRLPAATARRAARAFTAPMPGKIVKIAVREGDAVEERALLLVLEAMKMEHRIEASAAATVKSVLVKEGQTRGERHPAGGTLVTQCGVMEW